MYGVSLFVLREVFEVALILSVVMAATRGLVGRGPYIWGGILAGVLGAVVIAFFTKAISNAMDGVGQEVLNAAILIAAAAMIGWTVVWMQVHGKELKQRIKQVGGQIGAGSSSFFVLAVIVALSVFREGAEMVLFSFGAHAQGTSWADIAVGAAIGAVGGTLIGGMFYLGVITIFARNFLSVSSVLLAFLAAGLAAKGVYYLAMVGLVPELGYALWDTSSIISEDGIIGQSLSVLIGYTAQPSGIQLVAYSVTLLAIYLGLQYSKRRHKLADSSANYEPVR